jgi:aspartyl-tRNA(Asn)/glutamyl-tRNA(Gln) amidotransferase subunit A
MTDDLSLMPAADLLEKFRTKQVSPVEAAKAALARAKATEPVLNAFVLLCEEDALAQARVSEARWMKGEPCGPIDGVPTTVKDLFQLTGYPCRRGSLTTPDDPSAEDSPAVATMRRHGAVFIGKTTTSEFGCLGVTHTRISGITRNPWDPSKTPGGSSGGAAASVAVGAGTFAIGSDGGGSIRMPAAFTGIFGIKPTAGRVPYFPPSVVGSASCIGPLTRTVGDGALMLRAMADPDPRDWIGATTPPPDYVAEMAGGVKGLRICYSPTMGYAKVDEEVAAATRRSAEEFAAMGAIVEERDHLWDDPRETYENVFRIAQAKAWRTFTDEQRALGGPEFVEMALEGMELSLFDYTDAEAVRANFGSQVSVLLDQFDLLLTPQLCLTAFEAGLEYPEGRGMRRWLDWAPFTFPFNFSTHPAATMPNGFDSSGMPTAFQLVAQRGRDALAIRACRAYEEAHPILLPRLPV